MEKKDAAEGNHLMTNRQLRVPFRWRVMVELCSAIERDIKWSYLKSSSPLARERLGYLRLLRLSLRSLLSAINSRID